MKRLVLILLSFSLVMVIGCAGFRESNPFKKVDVPVYLPNEEAKLVSFEPGLEPQGLNGVKWEANLSALEGMEHYRTDASHGGIEFYVKAGDGFKLENGKLLPIQYGFWKGSFYVAMVTTKGPSDWNALKETIFGKYREGAKPFKNKEEYLWVGKNAIMALRYDENSETGVYYIRSDVMAKQMKD